MSRELTELTSREKREPVRYSAIDAYCGAGGLSYGLHLAGFNVLAAFDNDETAIKTYQDNLSEVGFVANARTLSAASMLPIHRASPHLWKTYQATTRLRLDYDFRLPLWINRSAINSWHPLISTCSKPDSIDLIHQLLLRSA